jgi:ABC-type phosphate transport system substrate-binding protein
MHRTFAAIPVFVVLLVVAACGDDSTGEPTTTATPTTTGGGVTTTSAGTSTLVTTTTVAPTTTQASGLLIEVAVHAGGIELVVDGLVLEPGVQVSVDLGSLVRIVTSGEVAEEAHVHGYDLTVDVVPGAEETLEFIADIPGIFEAELEGSGTLLFNLEVS